MPSDAARPLVVLMAGLPASGKTTTAHRLHAKLGGTLVRSCDVYRDLGIDLPAWVRRTRGFTRDIAAYLGVRDQAYQEMARRLAAALAAGRVPVVLDAVHGEQAKREAVYAIAAAQGAVPALVWCRCDDAREIARRFGRRHGRDGEPEHEASDVSVFHHIRSLWEDPGGDPPPDGRPVPVLTYDTVTGTVRGGAGPEVAPLLAALGGLS